LAKIVRRVKTTGVFWKNKHFDLVTMAPFIMHASLCIPLLFNCVHMLIKIPQDINICVPLSWPNKTFTNQYNLYVKFENPSFDNLNFIEALTNG
jgi:hypothetical protein